MYTTFIQSALIKEVRKYLSTNAKIMTAQKANKNHKKHNKLKPVLSLIYFST